MKYIRKKLCPKVGKETAANKDHNMTIHKYTISNDPSLYEAWPDVALTASDKLVCVFSECTHHGDRSYTRLMLTTSDDHGRSWTAKRPITEGTKGLPYYYNCARIARNC